MQVNEGQNLKNSVPILLASVSQVLSRRIPYDGLDLADGCANSKDQLATGKRIVRSPGAGHAMSIERTHP